MSKFKQNYDQIGGNGGGGMVKKVGLFAAIVAALFFLFNKGQEDATEDSGGLVTIEQSDSKNDSSNSNSNSNIDLSISDNYLPTSTTGEVIERLNYTLSYSEEHEQAEWVAYKLTKKSIQQPNVKRTGDFRPDPKVRKGSASPRDYYSTGYDRGHMVPAGDMNFDKRAMSETFYMSNMSPQIRNFNGGIWRELEETTRDWAYNNKELFIVSGPVLDDNIRERIGDNKVSVPDMYYKIILDVTEPEKKAIAFLMPNEVSYKSIGTYAVSIDEVEEVTGIDFFHQFLKDDFERELESTFDIGLWKFDHKKEAQRIKGWNKRK